MGAREDSWTLVEAAADTMRWVGDDLAEVTVGGRTCRVGLVVLRTAGPGSGSGGVLQVSGVEVLASLGRRPIRFDLGARGVTVPSMPTLPTGDAAFDERFVIQGIPVEVCVAGFDDDARRWALGRSTEWPSLRTEDGDLRLFHQTVSNTPGWSTSPHELRASIDWTLHVAGRLTSEFDQQQDDVRRASGSAAADEWLADVHSTLERNDRRRTLVRVLVFGVILIAVPLITVWLTLSER